MLTPTRSWLTLLALAGSVSALLAQTAPPTPAASSLTADVPKTVEGYVVTYEVKALAPELKAPSTGAPEAQALVGKLRQQSELVSKAYLAQDLSRQEILSTDFVLPAGTVVMHKAGDKFYVIADPKEKTYLVMDSSTLLSALEGGAGIVNSQYDARVQHTPEKKTIAGMVCRKSVVTVTYVSSIPFENDTVLVQQKNDVEIWHTSSLVSAAAIDHFFFKFQRDRTDTVRKVLAAEVGFPMEVNFVVTQPVTPPAAGKKAAPKPASAQPGSFHMTVTDVKIEKKLDSELFRIPPTGYRRIEKNPYIK